MARRRRSRAFAPLLPLARAVIGLLAAHVVMAWALLAGLVILLERLWFGMAGYVVPGASLAEHLAQIEALRSLQGIAWGLTVAVFLAWVHRAYGNLPALGGSGLGYSTRWAVGAFLVPGLNLLHPLPVMRDIWNASDPAGSGEARPLERRLSPWLLWWWTLLVAAVLLDPFPLRPLESIAARVEPGGGLGRVVLGALVEMAAAVLGIVVVGRIAGFQRESFARQDVVGSEGEARPGTTDGA